MENKIGIMVPDQGNQASGIQNEHINVFNYATAKRIRRFEPLRHSKADVIEMVPFVC